MDVVAFKKVYASLYQWASVRFEILCQKPNEPQQELPV